MVKSYHINPLKSLHLLPNERIMYISPAIRDHFPISRYCPCR